MAKITKKLHNDPMDSQNQIHPWMYRAKGEFFALFFSLSLLFLISILFASFDFGLFLLLLIISLVYIRLQQAQYLGNALRVHGNQFPEIYDIFREQTQKMGINNAYLYIVQDPTLNAHTLGITHCTVVLTSSLVSAMTNEELAFVIAHELGHFQAGHTRITSIFSPLGSNNPFSGLIFGFWSRKAEYTSDCCGLVVTKDIDSAISSFIKLSVGPQLFKKFDMDSFVHQMTKTNSKIVALSEILLDHPLTTNRIKQVINFWETNFKINA